MSEKLAVPGVLFVVGLGPGDRALMTGQARQALERAEVVVGYRGYLDGLGPLAEGKALEPAELGQEVERAERAVQLAADGKRVALVSSGDAGVYGMASPTFEAIERRRLAGDPVPEIEVVPGVTAVLAAAALLGAPLGGDFACVSLSDRLTPWELIERRLEAAAAADFVLALYNPTSRTRQSRLERAVAVVLRHRAGGTLVGHVRQAFRSGQTVSIVPLDTVLGESIDMFSLLIVGNSITRCFGERLITPRGYR